MLYILSSVQAAGVHAPLDPDTARLAARCVSLDLDMALLAVLCVGLDLDILEWAAERVCIRVHRDLGRFYALVVRGDSSAADCRSQRR